VSWCRWASICSNTVPLYRVDAECQDCPGSALYIYEDYRGGIVCCGCNRNESDDFMCATEAEMFAHIRMHHKLGDHVRRSLVELAHGRTPTLTPEWEEWRRTLWNDEEAKP
jgi:hypothetical protein